MARTSALRSIPSGVAARPRALGCRQSSVVGERARLEGERARLEQEIAAWRRNQTRAELRLRLVEARLAALTGEPLAELEPAPVWPGFVLEY